MKHGAPFTEEEDAFLRANYLGCDSGAMAGHLKRSLSSTQSRLRHLGLSKRKAKKQAAGESVRPHQTRATILFDDDLMQPLRTQSADAGISMSAYVNQIVRKTIQKKSKVA